MYTNYLDRVFNTRLTLKFLLFQYSEFRLLGSNIQNPDNDEQLMILNKI